MRYLLVLFLLFFSKPTHQTKNVQKIYFDISPLHKELLNVNKEDINQIFSDMSVYTNNLCKNRNISLKNMNWVISSLIAGCLNFYLINDHSAYKSFIKMNEIIGNDTKDCYTVGFSQLYLMYTFLKCNNISAIDIDWRIHYAHYQFIMNSKNNVIEDALANIDIGSEKNEGIKTFCDGEYVFRCFVAYEYFAKNYRNSNIYLQLKFLHEAEFYKTHSKNIILFVSNAIDHEYTTREQMDMILENLGKVADKRKVYIIYHTGGNTTYAIYQIYLVNNKITINTIYRDDLRFAKSYGRMAGVRYKTYLDYK